MSMKQVNLIQLSIDDLGTIIREAVSLEFQKLQIPKQVGSEDSDNDLLTREEAKKLLRLSYTTLWKYNKDKVLKAKKIGSRVYYLKSEIMNLLNNKKA